MEYLYYRIVNTISRIPITRETNNYYFSNNNRINKKTMKTGTGWDATHYSIESPELLKEYKEKCLKGDFYRWIEKASKITDIKMMKKLIEIELPENKE
jgi:hypothetical protein